MMNDVLKSLVERYEILKSYASFETPQDVSTSKAPNVFHSILSPIESYVVSLQSLLIWERPYLSAAAFVTLNIFYWLIVSWNRRLFSIVSSFALALFLYRRWETKVLPEIKDFLPGSVDDESWTTLSPDVLIPELSQYVNKFCEKMVILWKDVWKLRKENRGLFCALMCGFFSILAVVGKVFPGVLIVYVLVLFLTLGPGVALHLIPSTVYDQIAGYFIETDSQEVSQHSAASKSGVTDSDLEEFLPEVDAELIRQLSLKEDTPEISSPGRVLPESLGLEDLPLFGPGSYINESDDFSLYQGLNSFPSVEEEDESDIEEYNSSTTVPQPNTEHERAATQTTMHFDPTHFKENSSDSESEFTEGLIFNKTSPLVETEGQSDKDAGTSSQAHEQKSSASDCDDDLMGFEILDESDIPT